MASPSSPKPAPSESDSDSEISPESSLFSSKGTDEPHPPVLAAKCEPLYRPTTQMTFKPNCLAREGEGVPSIVASTSKCVPARFSAGNAALKHSSESEDTPSPGISHASSTPVLSTLAVESVLKVIDPLTAARNSVKHAIADADIQLGEASTQASTNQARVTASTTLLEEATVYHEGIKTSLGTLPKSLPGASPSPVPTPIAKPQPGVSLSASDSISIPLTLFIFQATWDERPITLRVASNKTVPPVTDPLDHARTSLEEALADAKTRVDDAKDQLRASEAESVRGQTTLTEVKEYQDELKRSLDALPEKSPKKRSFEGEAGPSQKRARIE